MCGFLCAVGEHLPDNLKFIEALNVMESRGPDSLGLEQLQGIFLGHRRLAIQDLDERANQPFKSQCGRYSLVFNGEIYNFPQLREELERQGTVFTTSSDSEVLLELYCNAGISCLHQLEGMFAFVVWDSLSQSGICARDPYGIKPLYFSTDSSGTLLLSSQVKALLPLLDEPRIDPAALDAFRALGSVPEPLTYLKGVYSVEAGTALTFNINGLGDCIQYHPIKESWASTKDSELPEVELLDIVKTGVYESISKHLISDVPVGVFLSGGIDSSVVAAVTRDLKPTDEVIGITIVFDEFEGTSQDEYLGAKAVATRYGLKHYVRRVSSDEFLTDLPSIIESMDQPSIDGINTWFASKAAAELDLKVVLSGVGGDELFYGYDNHKRVPNWLRIWRLVDSVPFGAFIVKGLLSRLVQPFGLNPKLADAPHLLSEVEQAWFLSRSAASAEDCFPEKDTASRYQAVKTMLSIIGVVSCAQSSQMAMAELDSRFYLRNQLLRDADWSSMAHSVELRTPLVDAALLQKLTPILPDLQRFPNKSLLTRVPRVPLPAEVVGKKKSGFGIPIEQWLSSDQKYVKKSSSRSALSQYVETAFFGLVDHI